VSLGIDTRLRVDHRARTAQPRAEDVAYDSSSRGHQVRHAIRPTSSPARARLWSGHDHVRDSWRSRRRMWSRNRTCHNLPMIFRRGLACGRGIGAGWDCLHRNTETRRHRLSSITGHREHMARLLRLFRRRRLTRIAPSSPQPVPALSAARWRIKATDPRCSGRS
jgi:hypothetical protein